MNANIKHVLHGFKNLNEEERKEFYQIIKDFEKYPYSTESNIENSIGLESLSESRVNKSTINFGPSPSGCPCCGRN